MHPTRTIQNSLLHLIHSFQCVKNKGEKNSISIHDTLDKYLAKNTLNSPLSLVKLPLRSFKLYIFFRFYLLSYILFAPLIICLTFNND